MIAPVVPAIDEETGAGPGVLGLLVAMFALGQLIGFPLAGRLVARRPASLTLAVSLALYAAGDLAFALGDGLGVYFPARLAQGVGAGGLWIGITFGVLERFPGQAYMRLAAVLAAYSVGGVAGPALGAAGGVAAPFLIHLALVVLGGVAVLGLGPVRERPSFGSDRRVLRTPGFVLASSAILLVAAGYGALEGALPLHFAERLSQAEIAALLVLASVGVGVASAVAGRMSPRSALVLAAVVLPAGIGAAGGFSDVAVWALAVLAAAVGMGVGETGALGVLLEETGTERIVLAMVVWSQVWAVGYFAAPAAAGGLAETIGFAAVGLVPLAGALLVGVLLLRR